MVVPTCSIWGQLWVCREFGAHAVSEGALVPRAAYIIGVQSSGVQVVPHLESLTAPEGKVSLLLGRQSAALWLRYSESGGLVGQECEDGSLRTEVRVRFQGEGRGGLFCRG